MAEGPLGRNVERGKIHNVNERIGRVFVLAAAIGAACLPASPQAEVSTPRFEDYPVTEIFNGIPAAPVLLTADQRLFRTRIREGVAKGTGVLRDGKEQPGPNFAGHYIVVAWACGSPCGMMAIVDAQTGKVYDPPISKGFLLPPLPETNPDNPEEYVPWVADVAFRLSSSLMIVRANPDPSKGRTNFAHYFVWKDNQWNLIGRTPLQINGR
jgi:hypothetical protein